MRLEHYANFVRTSFENLILQTFIDVCHVQDAKEVLNFL